MIKKPKQNSVMLDNFLFLKLIKIISWVPTKSSSWVYFSKNNIEDDNTYKSEGLKRYDKQTLTLVEC